MVLGVVGMVVSALGGLWSVRLVTGAGDFTTDALSGVTTSLQRVEDRLTFATEAGDPDTTQERLGAVRDGFAGAASAANSLANNPLISILPVDTEGLAITAGQVFVDDARQGVDRALSEATIGLAAVRERIDDFSNSLRFWARIVAVLFVAMAAWNVWAQYHLTGWGWRAWRTNPPEV